MLTERDETRASDDRYEAARLRFFNPQANPLLKPGYVNKRYNAGKRQTKVDAAERLWLRRDELYGWRGAGEIGRTILTGAAAALQADGPPAFQFARFSSFAHSAAEEHRKRHEAGRQLERALKASGPAGRIAVKPLPFYPQGYLIHVPASGKSPAQRIVHTRDGKHPPVVERLSGMSDKIHRLNALGIDMTPEGAAEEYAAFFCDHVNGENGCFTIIERSAKLPPPRRAAFAFLNPVVEDMSAYRSETRGQTPAQPNVSIQLAHPIIRVRRSDDVTELLVTIVYAGAPVRAALKVYDSGLIEMKADVALHDSVPRLDVSWLPDQLIEAKGK